MKKVFLIAPLVFVISVTVLFSQEPTFQGEVDTIPVIINGVPVPKPFSGGVNFSKPTFNDIDNDGDFDLLAGGSYGTISFYRNTGTATNPVFTLVTDNLASIDIGDHSATSFADIDNDGDFDLFVGKNGGSISFYRNTRIATDPAFTLVTSDLASIDIGDESAPSFADIDNDGDFDLFVGEFDGNINFYRNTGTVTNPEFTLVTDSLASIDIGDYSAPSFADIDNDGDFDLFVGEFNGNINFYRNTGTATNPVFTLVTGSLATIDIGAYGAPNFADIDNDGDFDLFVGEWEGNINFHRNTGTTTNPAFTFVTETFAFFIFDVGAESAHAITDIDNDGDFDLFVGRGGGRISFYRNTGIATDPAFTLVTNNLAFIDIGYDSAPSFADIDNDSDFDLLVGEQDGGLNFYRNVTNRAPVVANAISDQTLIVGCTPLMHALNTVFSDPDGNALAYTASSSATVVATANISAGTLTVTPVAAGNATITVTANDGRGGVVSDTFSVTVLPPYSSTLSVSTTVNFPSRANTADYKPTDYRIVGLPGASDRAVNEFFTGTPDEDWKVVWDNGASSNFFVPLKDGSDFKFSVGRAFWILNKGPWAINITAPSAPLDSCRFVSIPLHPSWNLITNPFISSVLWETVKDFNVGVNNPLWQYHGTAGFSPADTLKPYVGYYFDNATNLAVLKIPYISSSTASAATEVDPASWRVNIALSSGEFIDKTNSLGVANEASTGLDHLDFRKPRAIAATPTVSFHRPAWDEKYSSFATDIRPGIAESESWDFEVGSTTREASQLAFSGIGKIPALFEVYLIDESRARTINLRDDSLYRFTPAAEISRFSVVVGKKEAVQETLSSVTLPKEFALDHNYPNPFNPATTIPVAIPITSEVKLKVYNILGGEVKTLYAGMLEAGRYWFNWEGRDESGNLVTTGVYLCRLTTSTGVAL